ncbi:MAG: hypothetical protein GY884_13095, partial [Proteobacteria bacterium]|nr:hypothetical protein [Pseudomonadota bacterium]
GPRELIARVAGLKPDTVDLVVVEPGKEDELYRAVREFASGYAPGEVWVDPTGGKKSMSAAAAVAANVLSCPLVYVDGVYNPELRCPDPTSEFPRMLANPLVVFGDLERDEALRCLARGEYRQALELATALAQRLYESREAEAIAGLARGYLAWSRFQFAEARESLEASALLVERHARRGGWAWSGSLVDALRRSLPALGQLDELRQGITAQSPSWP